MMRVPETPSGIVSSDIDRMCVTVRLSQEELTAMLIEQSNNFLITHITKHNFQCCPNFTALTSALGLHHWRFAWSITCEVGTV